MLQINETLKKLILAEAQELNFFGKRKRETRIWCAKEIIEALAIQSELTENEFAKAEDLAPTLADWLLKQKPEKPASNKPASSKPAASTVVAGLQKVEQLPEIEGDKFLVVGVQNNTAPHADFAALKAFAEAEGYKLICLPIWYNKNAFSAAVEDDTERFDSVFNMTMEDCSLFGGRVSLRPSAAILPTAKRPENAAKELNQGELVTIVPSPKQHLLTLPRAPQQPIKEAYSTGCVTAINYTRSRAGRVAEKNHTIGGVCLWRTDDDTVLTHNVSVRNGQVMSIDNHTELLERPAVVLGDLHSEMKDGLCWAKTLDFVRGIEPCLVAVHDILHFSTKSHHNRNDGLHLYKTQDDSVLVDLERVITDINDLAAEVPLVYIVESNHNSALDNWLHDISYNPKRDPRQAKIYYLLNYLVCEAIDNGDDKATALQVAFEHLDSFEQLPELAENVKFGSMKQAFYVYGVDLSQHGHKGQNGSGGNTNLFSQWGLPMVTGHTHSPAIVGDVLTVGVTAKLDQGYNAGGASSWRQSHGIIFPNGTKQIYHVFGLTY